MTKKQKNIIYFFFFITTFVLVLSPQKSVATEQNSEISSSFVPLNPLNNVTLVSMCFGAMLALGTFDSDSALRAEPSSVPKGQKKEALLIKNKESHLTTLDRNAAEQRPSWYNLDENGEFIELGDTDTLIYPNIGHRYWKHYRLTGEYNLIESKSGVFS